MLPFLAASGSASDQGAVRGEAPTPPIFIKPATAKYNNVLLAACCLGFSWAGAQEVITNEQGQRIVVHADGAWSYFENDSLPNQAETGLYRPDEPTLEARKREMEGMKLEENQILLALIRARMEKAEKKLQLDSFDLHKETVPMVFLVMAEAEMRQIAGKEMQLEKKLADIRAKSTFYESLTTLPEEIRIKQIVEWESSRQSGFASNMPEAGENKEADVARFGDDILLSPPPVPCQVMFEGKDPQTRQQRKDLEPTVLFSFTGKELEDHFTSSDLIHCTGYLTALTGGLTFLTLEIAVASKNAPQVFGTLPAGSMLELVLLDGSVVRVFSQQTDNGSWQARKNAYVYKSSYTLGHKEAKLLRNVELDKVRLRWSKAAEEFQVYELDFFIRQFQCLY